MVYKLIWLVMRQRYIEQFDYDCIMITPRIVSYIGLKVCFPLEKGLKLIMMYCCYIAGVLRLSIQ